VRERERDAWKGKREIERESCMEGKERESERERERERAGLS
jgi:hypothetical protein